MTKEVILDKHVKYAWECDESSPVIPYSSAEKAMDEWAGYLISNSSHTTTTLHVPKHILDEYAKQQVISFTNWTTSAECQYSCSDEDQWNNIHNPHESITTEQLYEKYTQFIDNQFIEQQNKHK